MFRTGVILGEHQCLKDIEKCSKERCQNCPHGKTLDEMAEIISKALYETNPECYCVHPVSSYPCPTEMQERRSDWKNVDAIAKSRVLIHADEVIKALLGEEEK